jgi:hypothetical protein
MSRIQPGARVVFRAARRPPRRPSADGAERLISSGGPRRGRRSGGRWERQKRLFADFVAAAADRQPAEMSTRVHCSRPAPMQVKPRVGGSVGCGRGPSAFFEGSTDAAEAPSCSSSSSAGGDAGWRHPAPSLHEHLLRDLADSPSARRPARSRRSPARAKFTRSRSGEAGGRLRSRSGGDGVPEKILIALCRASHPGAVPDAFREALCAPPRQTCRTRWCAW